MGDRPGGRQAADAMAAAVPGRRGHSSDRCDGTTRRRVVTLRLAFGDARIEPDGAVPLRRTPSRPLPESSTMRPPSRTTPLDTEPIRDGAPETEAGSRALLRGVALRCQQVLRLGPRGVCFVVGSPRSATSGFSRWLNRQPGVVYASQSRMLVAAHRFLEQVHRFKTLDDERDFLLAGARRLVDGFYARSWVVWRRLLVEKETLEPVALPDGAYGAFVDSVRLLFPLAKLIFMVRPPVPTIWSITQRQWGYSLTRPVLRSYSLEDGIAIWSGAAQVAFDHVHDPQAYVCLFERLVGDPEAESRRVFRFLGLRGGRPFPPRPTKMVEFPEAALSTIREATSDLHQRLRTAVVERWGEGGRAEGPG